MSEFGSLLREHFEEIAPPVDVDRLADGLLTEQRLRSRPRRGFVVALAAAAAVLVLVGGTTLLLILTHSDEGPVVDETPTTTIDTSDTTVPPEPDTVSIGEIPVAAAGLPFTVLDSQGDAGSGASIVIGDDGVPMIAYLHHPVEPGEPSEIRIARCTDPLCSAPGPVTTAVDLESTNTSLGEPADIYAEVEFLLPGDGLPVAVWIEWEEAEDAGPSRLRSFKCADEACTTGSTSDLGAMESSDLWAAVGADGEPLIATRLGDWNNQSIELMKCTDSSCSALAGPVQWSEESLGWDVGIAADASSNAVIAFAAEVPDARSIGVVRCDGLDCGAEPALHELGLTWQAVLDVGIDAQDRPVVLLAGTTMEESPPDTLYLMSCRDATCADAPDVVELMSVSQEGDFEPRGKLVVGEDGSVTVLLARGAIQVLSCEDSECTTGVTDVTLVQGLGWPEADVALASNGSPVITIHANTDLGVIACAEASCADSVIELLPDEPTAAWSSSILAEADARFSGTNPVIEFGPGGNPVIAYLGTGTERGGEGQRIEVAKLIICGDPYCDDREVKVLDGGYWVNMTLLPDGRPVALYTEWTEDWEREQLFLAWCADPACTSWTSEKLYEDSWMNSTTALLPRSDGSVVVVFQTGNYYVNLVTCAEGECEGAALERVDALVDPNDNEWGLRWWMNSLDAVLLPDGRPVIAAAQGNGELRYVECLDDGCAESRRSVIATTLDSVTAALDLDGRGNPRVAFYDDGSLTVATCSDASCATPRLTEIGYATAAPVSSVKPSIAHDDRGNTVIAYWAPRALMLASCPEGDCGAPSLGVFADVRTYDLALDRDGSPVMVYFAYSDVEPPDGEEMFGDLVDLRLAICEQGSCTGD